MTHQHSNQPADLMLYQDHHAPETFYTDLGGVSLVADTNRRQFRLYVSPGDAEDQDYRDALTVLRRFGITGCHDAYRDNGVIVLVAWF